MAGILDPTRFSLPDLIGRDELPLDWSAARRELGGKRILVTGAGGSVGSRLAETLEPDNNRADLMREARERARLALNVDG